MTSITLQPDKIVFDGHAGKPEVCHGLSAISQMAAGYLAEKKDSRLNIQSGHLEISDLPGDFWGTDLGQAMVMALCDIADQYPEYVKIRRGSFHLPLKAQS